MTCSRWRVVAAAVAWVSLVVAPSGLRAANWPCPFDAAHVNAKAWAEELGRPNLDGRSRVSCAVQGLANPNQEVRRLALKEAKRSISFATDDLDADWDYPALRAVLVSRATEQLGSTEAYRGVKLLAHLGAREAVPEIAEALLRPGTADADSRRAFVVALADLGDERACQPLAQYARQPGVDYSVGMEAVASLPAVCGGGTMDALISVIEDSRAEHASRRTAAREARDTGDPRGVAAAEKYRRGREPKLWPAMLVGCVICLLGFWSVTLASTGWRRLAGFAMYVIGLAAVPLLADPAYLLGSKNLGHFWRVTLGLPLGVGVVGLVIARVLSRRDRSDAGGKLTRRMLLLSVLMWATQFVCYILRFVIGMYLFGREPGDRLW